ncbi:MAG: DUF2155 domain-containing protein [Magnetospirillum sp.]|nr:DUF2155 domain-containing protein [Magnetospirillum sp.]
MRRLAAAAVLAALMAAVPPGAAQAQQAQPVPPAVAVPPPLPVPAAVSAPAGDGVFAPIPPAPAQAQPAPVQPQPGQSPAGSSAGNAPVPGEEDLSLGIAVLGGLDKVTAQVITLEAPVGQPVHFGTLEIIARACKKHPPEESPESAAFLDIWDLRQDRPAKSLFRGWMFASSPALSAMEHPIYDIWVLDCRNDSSQSTSPR